MVKRKFSNKFRSQWITVKFYKENPNLEDTKRLNGVRFCEATKEAIMQPVLLDRESISCPGAQYAFGWRSNYKDELLERCYDKGKMQRKILKSMLSQVPYFEKPPKYIGLNTDGEPDLVMSYMVPAEIMNLIKMYHSRLDENLDVSLCTMMSICGGIAVKTYLDKKINLSFGCEDSRKFADIRRDNVAIGIPKRLFKIFAD